MVSFGPTMTGVHLSPDEKLLIPTVDVPQNICAWVLRGYVMMRPALTVLYLVRLSVPVCGDITDNARRPSGDAGLTNPCKRNARSELILVPEADKVQDTKTLPMPTSGW